MKTQLQSISSGPQILSHFKKYFDSIPDHRNGSNVSIPIGDAVMSAYAMFALKFPSALKFENDMKDEAKRHNLKNMYNIENMLSDTQMRTIVDDIPTSSFRSLYNDIFKKIQRDKKLIPFEFININNIPHYQLLIDGTEFFSSHEVSCDLCNVKVHKKVDKKTGEITETKTYTHSMLNAVIAHSNMKTVIPLMGEPIVKQNGDTKYDCELKALKRLLKKFRQDHPKLKVVLTADALYATGSLIKLLKQYGISFIINVKPKKNTTLFKIVDGKDSDGKIEHYQYSEETGEKIIKTITHKHRYANGIPMDNESSLDLKVNFIEYWEDTNWINRKKEECHEPRHFSWVTDINLNKASIKTVMKGGRNRWCIENEVFNTLKNHGYNYDRNYGHGYKNLANNFAMLMMLAFTFDQVLEMCSKQFKTLLKKYRLKSTIWEKIRFYYQDFLIKSWDYLIEFLIKVADGPVELNLNTS